MALSSLRPSPSRGRRFPEGSGAVETSGRLQASSQARVSPLPLGGGPARPSKDRDGGPQIRGSVPSTVMSSPPPDHGHLRIMLFFVLPARPGALGVTAMAELHRGPPGWEGPRAGAAPPARTAPSRCLGLAPLSSLSSLSVPSYFPYLCGYQMPAQGAPARSLCDHQRALGHHSGGRSRHQRLRTSVQRARGGGTRAAATTRHLAPPQAHPSAPCRSSLLEYSCQGPGSRPMGAPEVRAPWTSLPLHRGAAWYPVMWQPPADSPAARHAHLGSGWQVEEEPGFSVDPGAGPAVCDRAQQHRLGRAPCVGLGPGHLWDAWPM